jgi:FtsH-binding integral membrane protein
VAAACGEKCDYSKTDPTAVRQACGATALFVAAPGAGGYAVRRDLSFLYRTAFVLLLALLGAGIVLMFVRIPAVYTAWSLAGLAIFGLYTVIDFNRLRRAGTQEAIPLAAGTSSTSSTSSCSSSAYSRAFLTRSRPCRGKLRDSGHRC